MGVFAWIFVGLIAGWLAATITGSRRGIMRDIAIGLIGAIFGGFLARQFGIEVMPNFWGELITATIGAVLLLLLWKLIRRA